MPKFEDLDAADAAVQAELDKWPHPDAIGGSEWGPFHDLNHVTTEFGEFGVPRGKVLYFVMGTKVFPDGRRGPAPVETYRDALPSEQEKADDAWRRTRHLVEAGRNGAS